MGVKTFTAECRALTDAETVLTSLDYAQEVSRLTGLPVVMTAVKKDLYPALKGKIENLLPLT